MKSGPSAPVGARAKALGRAVFLAPQQPGARQKALASQANISDAGGAVTGNGPKLAKTNIGPLKASNFPQQRNKFANGVTLKNGVPVNAVPSTGATPPGKVGMRIRTR